MSIFLFRHDKGKMGQVTTLCQLVLWIFEILSEKRGGICLKIVEFKNYD